MTTRKRKIPRTQQEKMVAAVVLSAAAVAAIVIAAVFLLVAGGNDSAKWTQLATQIQQDNSSLQQAQQAGNTATITALSGSEERHCHEAAALEPAKSKNEYYVRQVCAVAGYPLPTP
jgi:outer membrane murein-binding lipoprotein Lpp